MSSIILYANKNLNGSYAKSKYWKVSDDGSAALAENSLYAGVTSDGYNRRTRLTFFPNSSIFTNQTITSVKLHLTVKSLYTSIDRILDTNIKISSTNTDSNAAYSTATGNGVLSAKEVGKQFTFIFSGTEVEKINNWCKNGTQFSIYLGIDDNNGKYGVQYYGYKSDYKPTLEIEYQPSASTGFISNNPKIGSSFRVTINKVSGTSYTHKIIISSSISTTTLSSSMLSTNTAYKDFTISAADTSKWINSSATSQRANCLIETYSNEIKIGNYSFEFVLSIADILDVTWNTYSITATSYVNGYNYLISGQNYPIVNLKATATNGSDITKYRLEINSCGVVLNKTYSASSGSLSVTLNDIKAPYTSSDTNFIIHAYAINSLGVESNFKEISKLCYAYALPSTILNPIRALNSSGAEDINGTYIYNNTALDYTSINGQNSIIGVTVTIGGLNTNIVSNSPLKFYASGAKTENEYNITVTIKDRVSTNTITAKIPSSNFLIHIKKGGKSIGIGRASRIIENTISLGWKLFIDNGIEFNNNSPISEIPLPVQNGGTGVTSYEALKQNLKLDYLPLSGGTINGNLNINGNLSITNANSFTYNSNKVAIINDNIIISDRAPNSNDKGLIWFRYE